MGKDMLLPMSAAVMFSMYFYMLKLGDVRSMYNTANGLWWEQRYRALCETAFNLTLNILLGKYFGVHGIILATMISLMTCNYIWGSCILFRHFFSLTRLKQYFIYQGKQTALVIAAAAVTCWVCSMLPELSPMIQLFLRAFICVLLPNLIFVLFYGRTDMFRSALKILKRR